MDLPKSPKKKSSGLQNAAKLSGVGIQMGLTIYLGNLLGSWLDGKFETTYLEITITLMAIFLSMYAMIRQVNSINK
ncbi:AtpZ/AtpI family protein [Flavobacteriaceae bacterium KMM 6897]|nr:AtpZ/AtpI family protein [Flavobacteriaceae bacterium KMM 6897]MEB8346316.1 AtpZ/AtpI family protein [Flavobacteriaceae bacterium KMM 6898]